jgi:RNA polymerase sigma-70 factor (ECF subfamily)
METKTLWQGISMRNQPRVEAPESEQPPDDELARAALCDPAQFAALYRRYVERVYRYFYGRTGSPGDAEDLTAQLFLEVLQALPRYRPQGAFAAWLFTLVRRRAIDFHRKQRPALPLEWAEEFAFSGSDPLGSVIQAEQVSRLGELYARLDDDRQELIRLRYAAGLTHKQVGQVLGRSEAAVAMALHRTLQWFQKNWEACDE